MKTLILLTGAALLVSTGPAYAKPNNPKHASKASQSAASGAQGYGRGGCPKGLAKKSPACIPPGQAKKQLQAGQRLPQQFKGDRP